ncbi:MAG TPA: enoyl-CoA hydratase/isomerase family protein [Rhodopila sp.]|jgi:enoyl-CoA hydratase/carnithine racemase|nr:enoyl-CoA hydratase/isomerase family protein [Rhodopila sp.]
MTDELLYDTRDGIGHITLNRPQARNALTFPMYERLAEIAAAPGDVRALVITGAGEKAFAAGTDINQFRAFNGAEDAMAYESRIDRVLGTLERCPVPTIAAIAGACTGGGAGIAAACDLRIAAANARFGFPIARTLGNCLSMSNIARLSALVGPARVTEMIFTARLFSAEEARSAGLVTELLPDQPALVARAAELATLVGGHAPLTMRATREALRRLRDNLPPDEDLIRLCYTSQDFREGMDAFLTKRTPVWRGA